MALCVSLSCTTLDDLRADFATAMAEGADLAELRLDCLEPAEFDRLGEIEGWIRQHADQLILTCRPPEQGGHFAGGAQDRFSTLVWLRTLQPRFIDLEYAAYAYYGDLRDSLDRVSHRDANGGLSGILLSEHHYEGRPPKLQKKFLEMTHSPAECVKLVWGARQAIDNFEACDLQRSHPRPGTVFCTGQDGLASRVLGPKFGSALSYCALRRGAETATGQPTLRDMLHRYRWRSIDEHTEVYGVLGSPVAHSLGPVIHNAALAACGMNAVYLPFRVGGDGFAFADFIKGIAERPWLDLRGLSVTSPHKHHAWLLTRDDLDPISKRIGAVNTLRFADGTVTGTNTDYQAATNWVVRGLDCSLPDLAGRPIDVLGAGGFARAAIAALRVLKAEVTVYNRSLAAANALADAFGCRAAILDDRTAPSGTVLINCTTVGMWPDVERSPLPPEQINRNAVVFDAVYNPRDTRLLRDARDRGCRTIDGLTLFIDQAVMQFTAMTGRIAAREVMTEAALDRV